MRNFLATLAVLAILAGVGFYAAGWMTYHKDEHGATVNIKTNEIERAAGRTVEKGKDLLDDVIDEQPVHKLDPTPVPDTKPVPVQPINPDETQPVKPVPPELDGPVTLLQR
jgi:hypothetical protein